LGIEETNMKIVFTLCSNNYLAQAKTLGDSIKLHNPEYEFFIGLTDKYANSVDYEKEIGHFIVPSEKIGIPDFNELWKRFSILEFNTNVKPFYFQYFINRYPDIEYLLYFDPDILLYNNLKLIENEFGNNGEVLLTPHILTSIQLDDKTPGENVFLNYGIYNLGFLGMKNPHPDNRLLEWWKERTFNLGYIQPSKGLFVDQLWFNLAPVFFERIVFSRHPGMNMAPWNLHERILAEKDNLLSVNNNFPLIFFHFSSYKYCDSNIISKKYTRYSFESNPELRTIYEGYQKLLLLNGIQKFETIKCYYMTLKEQYVKEEQQKEMRSSFRNLIKHNIRKILPDKFINVINAVRH